tara:strand:- start:635 stop:928 length:294 start_codon:yes stop_codon:yes gene_type:complete
MPKGSPGQVKAGDTVNKIDRAGDDIQREVAAKRFPLLMSALGNLPPTPGEIEKVRLMGYPKGFVQAGNKNRWNKTKLRKKSIWNADRESHGDSSEET